jgi:YfiH family protein
MTREGGSGIGPFCSFNLADWIGDDPAAVQANWRRWRAAYPHMSVARLSQVHGNKVHTTSSDSPESRPTGDGLVTAVRGIAVAVFTADCVPIIMIDPNAGVAAALHAGWRGTLANIAAEGVRAMVNLGATAQQILAALGPSIGPCCFEVGSEVADQFFHLLPDSSAFSHSGNAGKVYLDLRAIIRLQLGRAGLAPTAISDVGPCTRCANDRFFSRRGAGGVTTGLQMSFIGFDLSPAHSALRLSRSETSGNAG